MAHRFAVRLVLIVGVCWLLGPHVSSEVRAADEPLTISKSEEYFPDTAGSRWTYRGQISEGPLQTVELKFFTNVSTVSGTKTINGVTVTVFHDTNPGNHGPSDSFYRRDAVGIVYYGSEPGTPLEKHITPYQIFRFPLRVPSSFQQFDRMGVDFGSDMDRDQTDETVDTQGWSKVIGRETITVPAGTFQEAVKVEARMNMKIHLSGSRRTVSGIDVMTAWFAKGVGLVKYSERQELSAVKEDRGVVTEITEELEEYDIKAAKASLSRFESPTKGVFADDSRDHELSQIVFPTRFRTYP
ncbi:MAG: TapB family protein [Nitrospiraceae bacterium]